MRILNANVKLALPVYHVIYPETGITQLSKFDFIEFLRLTISREKRPSRAVAVVSAEEMVGGRSLQS